MERPPFKVWILILGIFCLPLCSFAKTFKNSYVSFEMPPSWDCQLENRAWLCRFQPSQQCQGKVKNKKACYDEIKKTKEALFILSAKKVGPRDKLKSYKDFLSKQRPILTKNGLQSSSKIFHVKEVKIGQRRWVDSMHFGSELPHYYTRYLATISGNVAILVTLNAHKLYYTNYSKSFFKTIKSLKVLTDKPTQMERKEFRPGQTGTLGPSTTDLDFEGLNGEGGIPGLAEPQGTTSTDFMLLFGALFLALFGIFFWVRNRRH